MKSYWRTSLRDIDECVSGVQKGKVEITAKSAGGRSIYLVSYGEKNRFNRTANLSSALGAHDERCYADKTGEAYRTSVLLVGGVHGGEFEGVCALLNLISIMETGRDFAGRSFPELAEAAAKINLLIIPCANPDGRSRVPFDSFAGKSFEELRYYNQGTWKDGSLCNWPDCKRIHPIKDYVDFLGAYFNDNGVNMMHDNFFGDKSPETENLFCTADEYVPDFTVLLHGGAETGQYFIRPDYSSDNIKQEIYELEKQIKKRSDAEGLPYDIIPLEIKRENELPPASFNLISALTQLTGEPCVTYESKQGLTFGEPISEEEIYRAHMILFEELIKKYSEHGGDSR